MPKTKLISLEGNDSAELILKACERSQKILEEENKINIPMYEAIATIVEVTLGSVLEEARKQTTKEQKETLINLFDYFEVGFTPKEDGEENEKGGNIVPAFAPLGLMKTMGKDDESQADR